MVDSIVATTGALFFNASWTLGHFQKVTMGHPATPLLTPNPPDFRAFVVWFYCGHEETLITCAKENWKPLEASARPSREMLKKAIDGYLDLFGGPNGATARSHLPFGSPCERVEGSRFINCTDGIPASGPTGGKANSMRRYVIDEVVGSADVLCSFTAVGNIPDSHELRILNSKIRYVHTITLCAIDNGPDWGPTCIAARAGAGKSTRSKLFKS
jgi:hypothetical protein